MTLKSPIENEFDAAFVFSKPFPNRAIIDKQRQGHAAGYSNIIIV